jgi:NDP-sugar pyrophosphorylase family protein
MKALLLAAGLGTRLKPITDTMPKALVVTEGKTLLEHSILHLKANGIREVIINVHHFPGMIIEFLERNENFGLEIAISDESGELLETGGALKKAAWFFDDGMPFVVRNADVLSDIDLGRMESAHVSRKSLATLAVRVRETSRYLLFDHDARLVGWENQTTGERKITGVAEIYRPLAFSGIQIVSPEIFPLITETGKFSLIQLYLRLSAFSPITGYLDQDSSWRDAGKM